MIKFNRGAIADLHVHSVKSDGKFGARAMLRGIRDSGSIMKTLAIADHGTTEAYEENHELAQRYGITLIPAIEISTSDFKGAHLLGYGMTKRQKLNSYFKEINMQNLKKLVTIIDILEAEHGIYLPIEFIQEMTENGQLSRAKIAAELAKQGYAKSPEEARKKYVSPNAAKHTDTHKPTLKEGIKMITDAGGVAGLAHSWQLSRRGEGAEGALSYKELEALLQG